MIMKITVIYLGFDIVKHSAKHFTRIIANSHILRCGHSYPCCAQRGHGTEQQAFI